MIFIKQFIIFYSNVLGYIKSMATFGMRILGNGDKTYLDTTTMSSDFFNGTQSDITITTDISNLGFDQSGFLITPQEPSTANIVTYGTNDTGTNYRVPGGVNNTLEHYYPPSKYKTGTDDIPRLTVDGTLPSTILGFGKKQVSGGTYGLEFIGPDGFAVIDQNTKAYYIQTQVLTGSTDSLPSIDFSSGFQLADYTQTINSTIIFPQTYDDPPLIFITQSDGPIAFNGMLKDVNGKYYAASIIANKTAESGYLDSDNNYNFNYFIVSKEDPIGITRNDYGLRVEDSLGNETFNSSYPVANIQKQTIDTPHMTLTRPSGILTLDYKNHVAINKNSTEGFCINNFYSIAGLYAYPYECILGWGCTAPTRVYGRFLNVYNSYAAIISRLSVSTAMQTPYVTDTRAYSYDFTLENVPNMTLFKCNNPL